MTHFFSFSISFFLPPYICRSLMWKQPSNSQVWHDSFCDTTHRVIHMCDDSESCRVMSHMWSTRLQKQGNSHVWHDSLQPSNSHVWHDSFFLDSSFANDAAVCGKRAIFMYVSYKKAPAYSYVWHDYFMISPILFLYVSYTKATAGHITHTNKSTHSYL